MLWDDLKKFLIILPPEAISFLISKGFLSIHPYTASHKRMEIPLDIPTHTYTHTYQSETAIET
jgi:hypothetical protein